MRDSFLYHDPIVTLQPEKRRVMLGAPSIIVGTPSILSEWMTMPFTQVDPYV